MQPSTFTSTRASQLHRIFDIEERIVGQSTAFLTPMTRYLHMWWVRSNGGRLPLKRQWDVTEHRPIIANLFLTELMPDGEFRFKLIGEDVIKMLGVNNTGKVVKNAHRADYGHALDEYYRSIVRDPVCKLCRGSLAFAERDFCRFESIDCPLSSDGERVDLVIGVMARVA